MMLFSCRMSISPAPLRNGDLQIDYFGFNNPKSSPEIRNQPVFLDNGCFSRASTIRKVLFLDAKTNRIFRFLDAKTIAAQLLRWKNSSLPTLSGRKFQHGRHIKTNIPLLWSFCDFCSTIFYQVSGPAGTVECK